MVRSKSRSRKSASAWFGFSGISGYHHLSPQPAKPPAPGRTGRSCTPAAIGGEGGLLRDLADHGCICTISFSKTFLKKRCLGLWIMVFHGISIYPLKFTLINDDKFLHKLTCSPFSRNKSENKNFKAYKRPATESAESNFFRTSGWHGGEALQEERWDTWQPLEISWK